MIQALRFFRRFDHKSFCTKAYFEPYYGDLAILRGLSDNTILKGELVVSHYNNARCGVITDSKERLDCSGFINRNRALSGDRVYVRLGIEPDTPDTSDEPKPAVSAEKTPGGKSCRVVGIESRRDQRFVARARAKEELVQPRDTRFPAMKIDSPLADPSLVLVKFAEWPDTQVYPRSSLLRVLGPEGSCEAEDDASLEINGLISERYSKEIDSELRTQFPPDETIAKELSHRRDLRKSHRVFTIDPPSAKDLDDAISVTRISPELVSIGVHVADVAYYLPSGSLIDIEARQRATSVYLPRQVYPMLPPYLSENLCSLLPNEDRLAFSVFFTLNEKSGEFFGEPEFVRTVIRSSARLTYDQVDQGDVPKHIVDDINLLNRVSMILKKNRLDSGAVCIDDRSVEEIYFEFHENKVPIRIFTQPILKESFSHSLIEELMVLTNKLVAQKLASNSHITVPVVRRHIDSESDVMRKGKEFLSTVGLSDTVVSSVTELMALGRAQLSPALFAAFVHTVLSQFNQAEYLLDTDSGTPLFHWGVGAERYMHFTSPIRRYADVVVHRKLNAIMHPGSADPDETGQLDLCNTNSRLASEAEKHNKLFYFTAFIKSFGLAGYPIEAVVREIVFTGKPSVVFFLPIIGEVRSQSLDTLGLQFVSSDGPAMTVLRDKAPLVLRPLQVVQVRAIAKHMHGKFHLRMDSVPPLPSITLH